MGSKGVFLAAAHPGPRILSGLGAWYCCPGLAISIIQYCIYFLCNCFILCCNTEIPFILSGTSIVLALFFMCCTMKNEGFAYIVMRLLKPILALWLLPYF